MRLNHPFSVRLANGSERTFATAEEMAKWIAQQRGLQMPTRSRRAPRRRSARRTHVNRVKSHVKSPDGSPLDRFNRNNTGDNKIFRDAELN